MDHGILLKKLFCLDFRDASFYWFQSYFCDRLQCSVIGDKQSSLLKDDHFGVPQGSVLGPLLFLIYINDIFSCINSNTFCHLYADDTIIVQSSNSPTELRNGLIQQLKYMSTWFYKNNILSINTATTEVIFFGKPIKVQKCKELEPVTFQDSHIKSTDKVKYLCVTFDEGMTWKSQANQARKKAYFNLNKIKKIALFFDDSTKHLLLNALVFPHISYCSSSWSCAAKKSTKKFESLLRSIDRVFPMGKTFSNMAEYKK